MILLKEGALTGDLYKLAFEGNPVAIGILILIAILFVGFFMNGGDMGVHEDTGRPIKSLNTREGKRAGWLII